MPTERLTVQPEANAAEQDASLAEIFLVARRRFVIIPMIVLPVVALTWFLLSLATPRYTAETLIMIDSQGATSVVSLDSVVAGLSGDSESVQSEAHVLGSRSLAQRVVETLVLAADPEFTVDVDSAMSETVAESAVLDTFLSRLVVAPLENSRVIAVRFSSESAEKAMLIANTITDQYLESRLENKFDLTRQANSWLSGRIQELREDVAESEAAVEQVRSDFGLLEGNGLLLASQELGELNTQLVMARTERTEAEARLQQVVRLSQNQESANTTLEVLQSPVIQDLRNQEAEVERRVAELSAELGNMHPRMIQLRAEARDLQGRIDLEIERIVAGLRNRVNVALARESALETSLEEIKERVGVANLDEIELRALEREADANQVLLSTLLARQKEVVSQQDQEFQQPDAYVVSRATVPSQPSWPQIGVILGLAFAASLVISGLVMLLLELLDRGFRSGEQLERFTGIPSIGFIPMDAKIKKDKLLVDRVFEQPKCAFSESMRTVGWSLRLACPDAPPKSVMITSTTADEGKSTIASCVAYAEASNGLSVALVDADSRRPTCHELTGVSREPGLTDILLGKTELSTVLRSSKDSKVRIIPAGHPTSRIQMLLGSKKMQELLAELEQQFDLVIVDSPPVMAAADARILGKIVDTSILVVRWGKTPRQKVRLAARQLEAAGVNVAGGLLSMVDVKANSHYGYGDSGVYAGKLAQYYAE